MPVSTITNCRLNRGIGSKRFLDTSAMSTLGSFGGARAPKITRQTQRKTSENPKSAREDEKVIILIKLMDAD